MNDTFEKIIALLDAHQVNYRVVEHPPEGRTEFISQLRGNRLAQAAKALVLMVRTGKNAPRYFLAVVPGDTRVNLPAVKKWSQGTDALIAPRAVAEKLTGCAIGSIPPFSFSADLPLVVDPALLQNEEIVFNAGRLDRSIFMPAATYREVSGAQFVEIARRADPL